MSEGVPCLGWLEALLLSFALLKSFSYCVLGVVPEYFGQLLYRHWAFGLGSNAFRFPVEGSAAFPVPGSSIGFVYP